MVLCPVVEAMFVNRKEIPMHPLYKDPTLSYNPIPRRWRWSWIFVCQWANVLGETEQLSCREKDSMLSMTLLVKTHERSKMHTRNLIILWYNDRHLLNNSRHRKSYKAIGIVATLRSTRGAFFHMAQNEGRAGL
uniref:Uncharacterized protein n=1 Tax=Tanacetum cinerariifolium TaxID=118510 RepID=A0A6L2M4M2_TANCI|nr:hypothetical protein [Tanacetum cinerariifolium]